MRTACCPRICRATVLSFEANPVHPKHQRRISTTSPKAQGHAFAVHNDEGRVSAVVGPPKNHRPKFEPPLDEGIRTSGKYGSLDYIHHKRGYAPNMPIPARKFRLPTPKVSKGIPDPKKAIPQGKLKPIRSMSVGYQRQLNAMRKGYMQWRYRQLVDKARERQEKAQRPPPPTPTRFDSPFAEKMTTPSSTDLLALERQLFARMQTPRARGGEGYHSTRHQALLEKQRQRLINDYLALYNVCKDFITTPQELDDEISRKFPGTGVDFLGYRPQHLESIQKDMELGSEGLLQGYVYRLNKDRESQLYNAVMGTVADGSPGYSEIMEAIKEDFAHNQSEQTDSLSEANEIVVKDVAQRVTETAFVSGTTDSVQKVPPTSSTDADKTNDAEQQIAETTVERVGTVVSPHKTIVRPEMDDSKAGIVAQKGTEDISTPKVSGSVGETSGNATALDTPTPSDAAEFAAVETERPAQIPSKKAATAKQIESSQPEQTPSEEELLQQRYKELRQIYKSGFIHDPSRPLRNILTEPEPKLHYPADVERPVFPELRSSSQQFQAPPDQLGAQLHRESQQEIIDSFLKHMEAERSQILFPELDSVDVDSEEVFEYLMKRQEFETTYPSRKGRRATNRDAWLGDSKEPPINGPGGQKTAKR